MLLFSESVFQVPLGVISSNAAKGREGQAMALSEKISYQTAIAEFSLLSEKCTPLVKRK